MSNFNQRRPGFGGLLICGAVFALVCHFALFHDEQAFVGSSAKRTSQCPKGSKVVRYGVDKVLKDRINGVTKTGKLTDAMRLIAAARVRRAQDGVQKSRPFSMELQGMIKGIVKKLKGSGLEQEIPMLRVPEKTSNVGIVLFMSNRGLCGAYNSFVIKRAIARCQELNEKGIVPKIISIGKKAKLNIRGRLTASGAKFNDTGIFFDMPDNIDSSKSTAIAEEIQNMFLSGEVDKVEVVYSKFVNLITSEPQVRTVVPLTPTGIEDPEDETFKITTEEGKMKVEREKTKAVKAKNIETDVIFDQEPKVILNSMLPLYLNSQILSMLYDAQASELAGRMSAMKAATDNANDLVSKLTTLMNKKRQAAITQEICEINAASLAFNDDEGPIGEGLGMADNENTIFTDLMREIEDGSLPDEPSWPDEIGAIPQPYDM